MRTPKMLESVHRASRRNGVGWWDEDSGTTHVAEQGARRTICGVRIPASAGMGDTRWTRGDVMRITGTPELDIDYDCKRCHKVLQKENE